MTTDRAPNGRPLPLRNRPPCAGMRCLDCDRDPPCEDFHCLNCDTYLDPERGGCPCWQPKSPTEIAVDAKAAVQTAKNNHIATRLETRAARRHRSQVGSGCHNGHVLHK